MGDTFGVILAVALIAAFLTTAFFFFSWWMESERRLRRAMKNALAGVPDMLAIAASEGKAAGLDLTNEQLAILWHRGAIGLVFDFAEVEGAEIIVDGYVITRVRRHYGRKELDVIVDDAESVILRLMFNSPECPEFEISLWRAHWATDMPPRHPASQTAGGAQTSGSASEGLRQGRRWLAHIEALVQE